MTTFSSRRLCSNIVTDAAGSVSSVVTRRKDCTMKRIPHCIVLALSALGVVLPSARASNWTDGMKEGKPAFKSMDQLAFGPEAILFVADTRSAAITALATEDTQPATEAKPVKVEGINQKIAGALGTTADQILINDLAVNPISRNAYLAVARGR